MLFCLCVGCFAITGFWVLLVYCFAFVGLDYLVAFATLVGFLTDILTCACLLRDCLDVA